MSLHAEGFEVLPQLLLVRLAEILGGERATGHAGGWVHAALRAPGERVGDGSQNSRIPLDPIFRISATVQIRSRDRICKNPKSNT